MQDGPENGSYSASEAAQVLNLSKRRVLQMLERRELVGEQDPETGRWSIPAEHVRELLAERQQKRVTARPEKGDTPSRELVEALKEQVEDLRERLDREQEANRENRRIIAALTSRIPELPPATAERPSEASETATEQPGRVEPQPAVESAQEPQESPGMHMPEAGGGPLPRDQQRPSERRWWEFWR